MKETLQRNYNLTDADLAAFAINLVNSMTRDATDFLTRSVTAADITELDTKANEFLIFPNDAFFEAQVMLASEQKNVHRENVQVMIRDIIGFAVTKWGKSSSQVHAFKAGNLTKDADKIFQAITSQAVDTMEYFLADLTSEGLTQLMIDAYAAEVEAFRQDLAQINIKVLERDLKSQERADKGNELYALVAKYCEIGKILYDDTNPSKYDDYVIYHYPPGVPGKILNMAFLPSTNTVSWNGELTADSYELQYAPNSPTPSWFQIYAGTATEYRHDGVSGISLYRCRGINENGNGYWSDVLTVLR